MKSNKKYPKSIKTLVADIYDLFSGPGNFTSEGVSEFADGLSKRIASKLSEERGHPTLRLSNLGTPCDRKLWYSINKPELAEPLPPKTRIKFLFGDILEEMLLWLAKQAGHTVEREQEEVDLYGVKGHIDAVIDGSLVDCKSASSYSFTKFEEGLSNGSDGFGYLTQLDSYLHATPGLEHSDEGHFLVIDKQLGTLALDSHKKSKKYYYEVVQNKKEILDFPLPPSRTFTDLPDGKSGNRKLGVECSYCPFKQTCWPGLRTFAYSRGPVSLTRVVREPDVKEIQ